MSYMYRGEAAGWSPGRTCQTLNCFFSQNGTVFSSFIIRLTFSSFMYDKIMVKLHLLDKSIFSSKIDDKTEFSSFWKFLINFSHFLLENGLFLNVLLYISLYSPNPDQFAVMFCLQPIRHLC